MGAAAPWRSHCPLTALLPEWDGGILLGSSSPPSALTLFKLFGVDTARLCWLCPAPFVWFLLSPVQSMPSNAIIGNIFKMGNSHPIHCIYLQQECQCLPGYRTDCRDCKCDTWTSKSFYQCISSLKWWLLEIIDLVLLGQQYHSSKMWSLAVWAQIHRSISVLMAANENEWYKGKLAQPC